MISGKDFDLWIAKLIAVIIPFVPTTLVRVHFSVEIWVVYVDLVRIDTDYRAW